MATFIGNIVFDCTDPDAQAAFWAAATGFAVQQLPTEVMEMIRREHPEWIGARSAVVDPSGKCPRLFFQKVPEPKIAKNRVHLDLNVADHDAEVARLTGLGARIVRASEETIGGRRHVYTVMQDPEGNEFCVQQAA